ncbi:hypothetical protein Tco_0849557 [Tanacetum coccineum]
MTNLRNEITRFQQRFDESFYEAWDRFNDLLRACPHHGFSELSADTIIKSKSRFEIHESRQRLPTEFEFIYCRSFTDVAALYSRSYELKNMMKTMLIDKQKAQAPASVKAVEQSCVTCGGDHSYRNCSATDGNNYRGTIFNELCFTRLLQQINSGNFHF